MFEGIKESIPILSAFGTIIGVGYFLKRFISRTDNKFDKYDEKFNTLRDRVYKNHQEYSDKMDDFQRDINRNIDKNVDKLEDKIIESSKEIRELNKKITELDAKQERLDIFSVKIEAIHKDVKDNHEIDKVYRSKMKEEISNIKTMIHKPAALADRIQFIYDNDLLTDAEKDDIRKKIEKMKEESNGEIKLLPFVQFIEGKIFTREKPEFESEFDEEEGVRLRELDKNWRVSEKLIEEEEERKRRKG